MILFHCYFEKLINSRELVNIPYELLDRTDLLDSKQKKIPWPQPPLQQHDPSGAQ